MQKIYNGNTDNFIYESDSSMLQERLDNCLEKLEYIELQINDAAEKAAEGFKDLAADIESTCMAIKSQRILQPFLTLFYPTVDIVNEYIRINGRTVPPKYFSAENAAEVYFGLKAKFFNTCMTLFTRSDIWESFAANPSAMADIASVYNTFLAIYQSIRKMAEEKRSSIASELESKRAALTDEKNELLQKLETIKARREQMQKNAELLGSLTEFSNSIAQENEFKREISIPLGYGIDSCEKLVWNLNTTNGVRIIVPAGRIEERDTSICSIVENTALHFLRSYPACATRLAVFDACKMPELEKLCSSISEPCDAIQDETDKRFIKDAILYKEDAKNNKRYGSEINAAFDEIYDMISSSSSRDLLGFNASHEDSFQPIVLFIIYGCSSLHKLDKEKANLIGNAKNCGVYFLIIEEEAENSDSLRIDNYREKSISDLRDVISFRMVSNKEGDLTAEHGGALYKFSALSKDFDMQKFVSEFQNLVLERCKRPLLLENLFSEYKRGTVDFSKAINIPVGRDEAGNIKVISLSSLNSTAHLAMIGKTGSGKSSILQALVLGGAYYYSPDELEFYLIDMKNGDAFYKNGVLDYSKLKHVKMLAAGCSPKDLKDFIAYILSKLKGTAATDIAAHNASCAPKDRIKRKIIVIDEYTQITDSASIDALETIARQGRSYGISLVLSSLNRGESRILTNNIGNLVEFKNDSVGVLIDSYSAARTHSSDKMFLIGRLGNCISATAESTSVSHFRAGFMNMERQAEFIGLINEKYSDYKDRGNIRIGDSTQLLMPYASVSDYITADNRENALVSAGVGRGIFGEQSRFDFGTENHHIKKLMLVGDLGRAESLEYSVMSAAQDARKYYISFGMRASEAFRNEFTVCENDGDIDETINKIYDMYQKRKQGEDRFPVLAILHGFGKNAELLKKLPPKPEVTAEVTEAAPSREAEKSDIDSFLARMNERSARRSKEREERKQRASLSSENLISLVRQMLNDGIDYGICLVISCGYDEIASVKELLDTNIPRVFRDIVAVPSLKGDSVYSKNNLLRALESIGVADILKNNSFTRSELVRCYHIIDKDYKQFIPYEWE